jgi:hypothetical protein
MAILFYEKKKREIYLALIAVVLILVLVFIWIKFSNNSEEPSSVIPNFLEKRNKMIQVDFEKLENEILEDLRPFAPILPSDQKFGRENPFAPYIATSTVILPVLPEE